MNFLRVKEFTEIIFSVKKKQMMVNSKMAAKMAAAPFQLAYQGS